MMKARLLLAVLLGVALLIIIVTASTAQGVPFKTKDLIGVWKYEFAVTEFADGKQEPQFGDPPTGMFILHEDGFYVHIIMEPNLPRVRSNRFKVLIPLEANRIARGVLAHFGTWAAQEDKGTFTVKIEKASYPNFDGVAQVRTITFLDDTSLAYVNNAAVTAPGAKAVARLRRVSPSPRG